MKIFEPFTCPGCGHIHDLRDAPDDDALSYKMQVWAGLKHMFCIFSFGERDGETLIIFDAHCTHAAAGKELVLTVDRVVRALLVEHAIDLASAMRQINALTVERDHAIEVASRLTKPKKWSK